MSGLIEQTPAVRPEQVKDAEAALADAMNAIAAGLITAGAPFALGCYELSPPVIASAAKQSSCGPEGPLKNAS